MISGKKSFDRAHRMPDEKIGKSGRKEKEVGLT